MNWRPSNVASKGSVAKNIFATFRSSDEPTLTATSCMVSEFLQQSPSSTRLKFDLALDIARSIQAPTSHGKKVRYEPSRYRAEPGRADARWRSSVGESVQAGDARAVSGHHVRHAIWERQASGSHYDLLHAPFGRQVWQAQLLTADRFRIA